MDGQCNEGDKVSWKARRNEVTKALNECGSSCWGEAQCTSDCMMKKTELSTKCANCFGSFSGCGRSQCWLSCMFNPTSQGCVSCVTQYCVDAFIKCSGLSSPM